MAKSYITSGSIKNKKWFPYVAGVGIAAVVLWVIKKFDIFGKLKTALSAKKN